MGSLVGLNDTADAVDPASTGASGGSVVVVVGVVVDVVVDDTVAGAFVVDDGAPVVLDTAVVDEFDGVAPPAPQPASTMQAARISALRTNLLRDAR